jgi:hypothetical protein
MTTLEVYHLKLGQWDEGEGMKRAQATVLHVQLPEGPVLKILYKYYIIK